MLAEDLHLSHLVLAILTTFVGMALTVDYVCAVVSKALAVDQHDECQRHALSFAAHCQCCTSVATFMLGV